jgi:transporter family-2 protein
VIASAAMAVRVVGVLLVGLCAVAGQLLGAVLLDLLLPAEGVRLSAPAVAGTAITLVAVVVAALPNGRRLRG